MSDEIRRLIDSWRARAQREGLHGQQTRPRKAWEVLDACASQLEALITVQALLAAEPPPADPLPLGWAEVNWQRAALRVGEELATAGPDGYYDFTPAQWMNWALATLTRAATEPR